MKVRLARTAGFCMGVRRAMDIVLDTANKGPRHLYTEGPLIHNSQVLSLLQSRGIAELDEATDLANSTVVVRAHGITPERRDELKRRGARLRDATCPHVARVQAIIKGATAHGREAIIVGDSGHGEVVGIQGFARNGGHVIQTPKQVDELPDLPAVSVVAQTTQNRQVYEAIAARLKEKYPDCEVHDTICDATSSRQREAIALAQEVDAMVVVGGRHSANTCRLVELCRGTGTRTYHVETEDELETEPLRDLAVVGVTAGASTPNWMISRVVDALQAIHSASRPHAVHLGGAAFRLLVHTNLYLATSALALAYANCRLMHVQPHALPWVAFLYMLSMQTFNTIVEKKSELLNDPGRARFLQRHEAVMLTAAIASVVVAVVGSWYLAGPAAFGLLVVASALGGIYRVPLMPVAWRPWFRFRRLADLAGTREIFITGAWVVCTVLIPALAGHKRLEPSLGVALCFAGAMVFVRTITLDIRDIQGDQIVGKETLPTFFGLGRSMVIVVAGLLLAGAVMAAAPRCQWASSAAYPLLACLGYAGCYLLLHHWQAVTARLTLEGMVDANFLLAGCIALVWPLA